VTPVQMLKPKTMCVTIVSRCWTCCVNCGVYKTYTCFRCVVTIQSSVLALFRVNCRPVLSVGRVVGWYCSTCVIRSSNSGHEQVCCLSDTRKCLISWRFKIWFLFWFRLVLESTLLFNAEVWSNSFEMLLKICCDLEVLFYEVQLYLVAFLYS